MTNPEQKVDTESTSNSIDFAVFYELVQDAGLEAELEEPLDIQNPRARLRWPTLLPEGYKSESDFADLPSIMALLSFFIRKGVLPFREEFADDVKAPAKPESNRNRYWRLHDAAYYMGVRISGGPPYREKIAPLQKALVRYTPSPLLGMETRQFYLPEEFNWLELTILRDQKSFRRIIREMRRPEDTAPIMELVQTTTLLTDLQVLAEQAGGWLQFGDVNQDGLLQISYRRCPRLGAKTLKLKHNTVPLDDYNFLNVSRRYYTLRFLLPFHLDELTDLLKHDGEVFRGLPEDIQSLIREQNERRRERKINCVLE